MWNPKNIGAFCWHRQDRAVGLRGSAREKSQHSYRRSTPIKTYRWSECPWRNIYVSNLQINGIAFHAAEYISPYPYVSCGIAGGSSGNRCGRLQILFFSPFCVVRAYWKPHSFTFYFIKQLLGLAPAAEYTEFIVTQKFFSFFSSLDYPDKRL